MNGSSLAWRCALSVPLREVMCSSRMPTLAQRSGFSTVRHPPRSIAACRAISWPWFSITAIERARYGEAAVALTELSKLGGGLSPSVVLLRIALALAESLNPLLLRLLRQPSSSNSRLG